MEKPKTSREVLDVIDDFFANDSIYSSERKKLWDILAAIRGPDNNDLEDIKATTTAVIRTKAFPRAAKDMIMNKMVDFAPKDLCFCLLNFSSSIEHWHFITHVMSAKTALGLP